MGWVPWPLYIFVSLASFSAFSWPNIWPKMWFPELCKKLLAQFSVFLKNSHLCSTRLQNRNLYRTFLDGVGSDQSGGILSPFMGTACFVAFTQTTPNRWFCTATLKLTQSLQYCCNCTNCATYTKTSSSSSFCMLSCSSIWTFTNSSRITKFSSEVSPNRHWVCIKSNIFIKWWPNTFWSSIRSSCLDVFTTVSLLPISKVPAVAAWMFLHKIFLAPWMISFRGFFYLAYHFSIMTLPGFRWTKDTRHQILYRYRYLPIEKHLVVHGYNKHYFVKCWNM